MTNSRLFRHAAAPLLALAATMLLAPSRARAQTDTTKKTSITGTWIFTVTTDGGGGTPTVTIKQNGDSVTGHYSSQVVGEQDFKGTFKDNKLTFVLSVDANGTALNIAYTGAFDGKDSMKGTVDFGGLASGTFTAKKKP